MTPNRERYEEAASKRRTDFIIKMAIFAVFIVSSALVIIFSLDKPTYILIAAVAILWFGFSLYKTVVESHPVSLFTPEYEGTVVKLYSALDTKSKSKPISELYIATDDGKLYSINSLQKSAVDTYRVGDRVLHIKGTLYPVIISRKTEYHPCPICGWVAKTGTSKKCEKCAS